MIKLSTDTPGMIMYTYERVEVDVSLIDIDLNDPLYEQEIILIRTTLLFIFENC